MLAFALGCDLRQTQRLLRLADVAELWPKVRRDAIIIWCIERGYTREECDDELYRLKERAILKVTGTCDERARYRSFLHSDSVGR